MKITDQKKPDDPVLERLRQLGCTTISDALDRLGLNGQCLGIMPLDRKFRLAGRAFTVHYVSVGVERGTVGDYIDELGPGDVVVLDNAGRLDATVWGDLLTYSAHQRGVAGTVIDGVCRDIDRSIELNYSIFSRGNWMRTGKDRVMVAGVNVPVNIGGARVEPGDYLLGDGDGVVVIPAAKAPEILAVAQEIYKAEEAIRAEIASGVGLKEARARVAYFDLQRRHHQ